MPVEDMGQPDDVDGQDIAEVVDPCGVVAVPQGEDVLNARSTTSADPHRLSATSTIDRRPPFTLRPGPKSGGIRWRARIPERQYRALCPHRSIAQVA